MRHIYCANSACDGPIGMAEVRAALDYDAETGVLTWRDKRRAGKAAGYLSSHGYVALYAFGRIQYAHRLAWVHVHGEWPKEIDHINGDRADNRLANLRACEHWQNLGNQRRKKATPSGFTGVYQKTGWRHSGRRWEAKIKVGGKLIRLGTFPSAAEASAAYQAAAAEHRGQFATGGQS